jgi:putative Holliday junction resolvase
MNILGIDYGSKNIGLAKINTRVSVVLPFGIIDNHNKVSAVKKLTALIAEEKIDQIVAGLPYSLDGSENANTVRVREFFTILQKECGVPVEFVSEIFSSQAGDRMGRGASRDEKAAMIILQNYLDKKI